MSEVLISAETEDAEWSSLVYSQALEPLLNASRQPWEFVKNMTYTVQAHLREQLTLDDGRILAYHGIETTSRSERVLPAVGADGTYWISVARTKAALLSEYGDPACLAREIVSLEDQFGKEIKGKEWLDSVKQLCSASITINGEVQDLHTEPGLEGEVDVLRWKLRPEAAGNRR